LSQHNKDLAALLKPCGDLYGDQALEFYAKHTAQIEVEKYSLSLGLKGITLPSVTMLFPDQQINYKVKKTLATKTGHIEVPQDAPQAFVTYTFMENLLLLFCLPHGQTAEESF